VMKRVSLVALVVTIVMFGFGNVATAQQPKAPATYEQALLNQWRSVHDKILTMAKDTVFPDDKLGWRPHPDSRSVLEEFRHVTIGLEMTAAMARGEKFDFEAREKADAGKPKTRASMLAEMEKAIAESYPLVQSKPMPQLLGWLEHQGEHYGKLVTAYRANGIVPPISRQKS
jgi:DinB family protein